MIDLKAMPLYRFELIQDALDALLRSEGGWNEARAESILFSRLIEALGYERANSYLSSERLASFIVIEGLSGRLELFEEQEAA
jgi:hypothetical protein